MPSTSTKKDDLPVFETIKTEVPLLDVLAKDLSVEFKQAGEKNWIIDGGKEFEQCPFCGHHDCFKVHAPEGEPQSHFYKCFSCGERGSVIDWVAKRNDLTPAEAALRLAKEYSVELPKGYSPIQEVFTLAAEYYHQCLVDTCNRPFPLLGGKTPLEFQTTVRRHKPETIAKAKVGWSDGGLIDYLEALGIDSEVIDASGLRSAKTKKDFLPQGVFIYPHYVGGKASHFTFKDPSKKLDYQLPKRFSLNGYTFYGQDTIKDQGVVMLVEGENDYLSVLESGSAPGVMATIGQLSGEQLEWLRSNCKTKRLITIFDPDDAGDGYRERVEANRKFFAGLIHVRPPEDKDIDDHLTAGANLVELVKTNQVSVTVKPTAKDQKDRISEVWGEVLGQPTTTPTTAPAPVNLAAEPARPSAAATSEVEDATVVSEASTGPQGSQNTSGDVEVLPPVVASSYKPPEGLETPSTDYAKDLAAVDDDEVVELGDSPVRQHQGCYWKMRFSKDGVPEYIRISNFIIILRNVYVDEDGDRLREIVVRRNDGLVSDPFMISSEDKVSLKSFKVQMARAADCEWSGKEPELDAMWRLVYDQFPDRVIRLPRQVGRHERMNAWIFRNVVITASGAVVTPDENGVFWISGRSVGLRPQGINTSGAGESDSEGIPSIETSLSREEAKDLLSNALNNLAKNLGDKGSALLALGWIHANIFSNEIFRMNTGMSMLLFWGLHGGGKSTLAKWLQDFYGIRGYGSTSVPLLKTGIGFLRKGEYYSSLPLFLDELRSDELSKGYYGMIRSWYDREGRSVANRDGFGVKSQKIRSNLIIGGEDLPEDPATRERCVAVRILRNGRETVESYQWFEENRHLLSNITYYWILDSTNAAVQEAVEAGIKALDKELVLAGCSKRTSKNWAAAGYFGDLMAQAFYPDFDFRAHLKETCVSEQKQQSGDTTLAQFFEQVDILRSAENPKITTAHMTVDGNMLHIWFPAVFSLVKAEARSGLSFSKGAVLSALREETWFVSDDKKVMLGLDGGRKVVVTLDLSKAPGFVRSAAGILD